MISVIAFVKSHYILSGSVYLSVGLIFILLYWAVNSLLDFTIGLTTGLVNAIYRDKVFPSDMHSGPSLLISLLCLFAWPLVLACVMIGIFLSVIWGVMKAAFSALKNFLAGFSEFQSNKK